MKSVLKYDIINNATLKHVVVSYNLYNTNKNILIHSLPV